MPSDVSDDAADVIAALTGAFTVGQLVQVADSAEFRFAGCAGRVVYVGAETRWAYRVKFKGGTTGHYSAVDLTPMAEGES